MDFSNVIAQEDAPEADGELVQLIGGTADGSSPKAIPPIWSEVSVCFRCYVFFLSLKLQ